MEETVHTEKDYQEVLSQSFKVAAIAAGILFLCEVINIFALVKETDSFEGITTWFGIACLFVWGGALVKAGNKICDMGHKETGVISAGGALIFWAIVLIAEELFAKEESFIEGAMGYVWTILELLGPAIVYFSFKQEDNKEDKYFDTAGWGMGAVAISIIIFFAAFKIMLYSLDGGGISMHAAGDYVVIEQSKIGSIGVWIAKHFKMVCIICTSVSALGILLAFGSMCSYKGFINDLVEEEEEAATQANIAAMAAEYKKSKEENK